MFCEHFDVLRVHLSESFYYDYYYNYRSNSN